MSVVIILVLVCSWDLARMSQVILYSYYSYSSLYIHVSDVPRVMASKSRP